MKQYLNLLQNILDNGVEKESGRANMPNTIGISHGVIQMDMAEGFPLLTTKKMYLKGIIHELLWILSGDTNIKYLVDNNVNIWNGDAYRWYLTKIVPNGAPNLIIEEFIEKIKAGDHITISDPTNSHPYDKYREYYFGELGKVYGYQWRNQNGVDQVKEVIDGLKNNPFSRYHIIDAWNKADFKDMALPPCHLLYQFIVRPLTEEERIASIGVDDLVISDDPDFSITNFLDSIDAPKFYLDLNMYQRSCDTFLGVPFNIASMSLLLMIFAKVSNMIPGVSTWIGGDTHLYVDHIDVVKEQILRDPYPLSKLIITKELNSLDDILDLKLTDFVLSDYRSYDALKGELFTGLKK
jgi:thymidylate synthase